ncbi:MAG: NINE protein [Planctomycetota bacterium]
MASAVPPPQLDVGCPYCQARMMLPVNQAGSLVLCSQCQGQFQIPIPTGHVASTNPFSDREIPPSLATAYSATSSLNPDKRAFIEKKILAGIMGLLFGGLGVHKFVLGFTNAGLIMLAITIAGIVGSCLFVPALAAGAMSIIGFVEGSIYLTKSDEDFYHQYAIQKKDWF